jgi:hypothetical protein
MYKPVAILILSLIFICTGCKEPGQDNAETGQQKKPVISASFIQFANQVQLLDSLPYSINEVDLQFIEYQSFLPLNMDTVKHYFKDVDKHADYYLVCKPIVSKHFTAMIILQSLLDTTLFTADERFFLNTYSPDGKLVSNLLFAASVTHDEKHFRSSGQVFPDWNITVEKYVYEFKNGAWMRLDEPIKAVYYEIDSLGKIEEIHSEIHIKNDSSGTDLMSALF